MAVNVRAGRDLAAAITECDFAAVYFFCEENADVLSGGSPDTRAGDQKCPLALVQALPRDNAIRGMVIDHAANQLGDAIAAADHTRVDRFLAAGISANICNGDGWYPLHCAASRGAENLSMIELLLRHGADPTVHLCDEPTGLTPAALAQAANWSPAVQLLRDAEAKWMRDHILRRKHTPTGSAAVTTRGGPSPPPRPAAREAGKLARRATSPALMASCPELLQEVRQLVSSCTAAAMGRARDQRDLGAGSGGGYQRLVVAEVLQVRNETLLKLHRAAVAHYVTDVDATATTQLRHKSHAPWMDVCGLLGGKNEVFLFHGTKHENATPIAMRGFDEHFAKAGFLGQGIYFSDSSSKADQYATPDADGFFYMFVARVALGRIRIFPRNEAHRELRAPPEGFDSVEGGVNFREFVVYRGAQAYPEFLIKYRRE